MIQVNAAAGLIKGLGRCLGNIGRAKTRDDPYWEGGFSATVGGVGTKQAYALKLCVAFYTDWEPLKDSLTSVSRAAFAGGFTVGVAMGTVTESTTVVAETTVLSLSGNMDKIELDDPPESLTKTNRDNLIDMGIPEMNANYLTATMATAIVKIKKTIWQVNRKGTLLWIDIAVKP